MKRIYLPVLIVALLLSLCACDGAKIDPDATAKIPAATTLASTTATTTAATTAATTEKSPSLRYPWGYRLYESDDLCFAYPAHWTQQEGSVVLLMPAGGGNNITVAYEPKTDFYRNMTLAQFETIFRPALESMGVHPQNPSVEQTVNEKYIPVTRISYTTVQSGVEMTQTILIFDSRERTYSITVTVVARTPDDELVENVFDTLTLVKG